MKKPSFRNRFPSKHKKHTQKDGEMEGVPWWLVALTGLCLWTEGKQRLEMRNPWLGFL